MLRLGPEQYWFPKPYADLVARLRVPAGFALAASSAWFSRPTFHSLALGLPISAVGIWIRAWAAGHLAKNQALATGGPYAYTRNPLYTGTLLVAVGLVIASRSTGLAVLFGCIFVLVYLPVIELEEQHLRKLFPEYAAYARRVPKLRPRWPDNRASLPFRWSLYAKNREYQALAGFIAGAAFLIWKASQL
jgi:protein-S-isoprenylcysteine O-methyltransferase Ste14